jgi:hypothetical protein
MANRKKPYVPIFRRTPARITEPAVGASTCASGSQVWNGNRGTLIANASAKPELKRSRYRELHKVVIGEGYDAELPVIQVYEGDDRNQHQK